MQPWYATREQVKAVLDVSETARANAVIDRNLAAATGIISGAVPGSGSLHRRFYPERRTMTFDWPSSQSPTWWRYWLDANELVSIESATAGGRALDVADLMLRPDDGPPYNRIEIDRGSNAAFTIGSTPQRALSITGVYAGAPVVEAPAGSLTAQLASTTATSITVSDSAAVGVGSILRVDSERLQVTGKSMLDTGQNLGGTGLAAQANAQTVPVADGSVFAVDELLLVDAERMQIIDIAGNTLIVKRGADGSTLAAHTAGADIYAARKLTVVRGVLGTTAAAHNNAAPILGWVPPPLVNELAIAEAINLTMQGRSGWARTTGSGDNVREASGRGLRQIRDDAYTAHGRKARTRAVV